MPRRPCKCPDPENGSLPSGIRQAVMSNAASKVSLWLSEEGSDVNAADHLGFPMLYTACAKDNKEVVEELLKHPELHLNPKLSGIEKYVVGRDCRGFTPLCIAAYQGHTECVKLLLNASLPCQIDPNEWIKHYGTAIMIACDNNHWNVVSLIFRHQKKLSLVELDQLLPKAKKNNQMKLLFSILYELFSKSIMNREWNQATCLLKRIDTQADLHVPLAKAAIAQDMKRMRNILQQYHEQDFDGALLAIAVEGGSQEVVEMLLMYCVFSKDTRNHALLLATINNNLDVLPALLKYHFNDFKYGTLCQARNITREYNFNDAEKLLTIALDRTAETTIPPRRMEGSSDSRVILPLQSPLPTAGEDLVSQGDDCYQNDTDPPGMVLILNYKEFDGKPDMVRQGSDVDINKLQMTFGQMGYSTQILCNLTEDQTTLNLVNFREMERLQRCGCLVVVVMSHGVARQTFHTSDMQVYTVDKLLNHFSDRECPHLRDKAKIFLFNFCRGTDVSRLQHQTDAVRTEHKDMLCIYSAQEGFVSYRDPVLGSPFISTWCQTLAKGAFNSNMEGLLKHFMKLYSKEIDGVSPEIQNLMFYKEFWFRPRKKLSSFP